MSLREINFDGIVGPSHNYAGLSAGNIASTNNYGSVSRPREAALQGVEKMRANLRLGLAQGFFMPHLRPNRPWLDALGVGAQERIPDSLIGAAWSASAMWAANAATVSPAPDTADGRCHLTVANLRTMHHRAHEWIETLMQLRMAFSNERHFAVNSPIQATFGDEGAANHMRLAPRHDARGVEVFVYGIAGGPYPVRQHVEASRAIARLHRLDPNQTLFVAQSEEAIAAGAFHNDVVAVANEHVLFAHEQAFANKGYFYNDLRRLLPEVEIVEVPASRVSLDDAVSSYLFNAQLVTLPSGGMALILPEEARANPAVSGFLQELVAGLFGFSFGAAAAHAPATHRSPAVHGSPSLHAASAATATTPPRALSDVASRSPNIPSVLSAVTATTRMSPGCNCSIATCSIQLSPGCASTVTAEPATTAPAKIGRM